MQCTLQNCSPCSEPMFFVAAHDINLLSLPEMRISLPTNYLQGYWRQRGTLVAGDRWRHAG